MKPPASTPLLAALLFGVAFTSELQAQVPPVITYQGRIHVDGEPFTGTGQFKFALVDAGTEISETATATAVVTSGFITGITVNNPGAGYVDPPTVTITDSTGTGATATAQLSGGMVSAIVVNNAGTGYSASPVITLDAPPSVLSYVSHWSNDGTSTEGGEPVEPVEVAVADGLFVVGLGDTSLGNMDVLPHPVFNHDDLHLRIWFDDGVNGFARLQGDQPVRSTAYAYRADHSDTSDLAATVKAVEWRMIQNVPNGFADGVDNDTHYTAGTGLVLDLGEFSISDGGVGVDQLANNSVTASKIANGAVGQSELADDAVWTSKILNGSVGAVDLAANSVSSDKIQFGAVTEAKISNNAVTSNKIANNTIQREDLHSSLGVWESIGDWQVWEGANGEGDGRVGINTSTVSYPLTVNGDGVSNVAARFENDYGSGNVIYSTFATSRPPDDSKDDWTVFGVSSQSTDENAKYNYGFRAIARDASDSNYGVWAQASGGSSSYGVYSSGNTYSTGSYLPSDRKLKKDIETFTKGLETVMALRPITSKYKTEEFKFMNLPEGTRFGFVAQEVQEFLPQLTKRTYEQVGDTEVQTEVAEGVEFTAVNYTEMIPVLVSAMQEQQAMIEQLKLEVGALKMRLAEKASLAVR